MYKFSVSSLRGVIQMQKLGLTVELGNVDLGDAF